MLLFGPGDVRSLFAEESDFSELIGDKRRALVLRRKVLVDGEERVA